MHIHGKEFIRETLDSLVFIIDRRVTMSKNVLILASEVGLWAEELQAPWDALKRAGHHVTLGTRTGKTPLPIMVSMDPEFIDPLQGYQVNPVDVVYRTNELLDNGEWDNPLLIEDANPDDYDALVIVGGPGAALDLAGNRLLHKLILDFYKSGKPIGALCYAVACLVWTRDPDNDFKSIIYGRTVAAHPSAWDFDFPMGYKLVRATKDNPGTNLTTQGFVFPLQYITEDAVGPEGMVLSDVSANRENPQTVTDYPFVTALSVESSIAFGDAVSEAIGD
jgi:putative intracellular protease/amidase